MMCSVSAEFAGGRFYHQIECHEIVLGVSKNEDRCKLIVALRLRWSVKVAP